QKSEVSRDPDLVRCREKRARALQRLKQQGHRNRAEAEGTDIAAEYDRCKKKAHSLSQKLKIRRLRRAIREFHSSVHVEEIERQLKGIKPPDVIVPPTIQYDLPERARLARLLARAADSKNMDELQDIRTELVSTIAQLCTRRESLCRDHAQRGRKAEAPLPDPDPPRNLGPQPIPPKQSTFACCPFCRWADDSVGSYQRTKLWRIDSLARHLRLQHLRLRRMPLKCPFGGCSESYTTWTSFATTQHTGMNYISRHLYCPSRSKSYLFGLAAWLQIAALKGTVPTYETRLGKACHRGVRVSETYTLCGTPEYLAPEVILNKGHTTAVDWWALGILIYEFLTGYPPIVQKPVNFPQEPAISPEAQDIIRSLCNADRSHRLGNVSGGVKTLKDHPFFRGVNWDDVFNRRHKGPIIPPIRSPGDAQCFDVYPEEDAARDEYTDDLRQKYDGYFQDF
ncbi:hypothetical protein J7T55_001745, partial [Diaporthe amygdali]|uniref:uncharacterized protein n=1 Tax=Phomopsis amygdali TaxID=1214568 RepID=UPI0022FEEFEF